jgi:hypothetical protein
MANIEITFRLPEPLLEEAQLNGVPLTDESIAQMIEAELVRAQAVRRLRETMQKLEGSLSPEEIEEELARAKADRFAADETLPE